MVTTLNLAGTSQLGLSDRAWRFYGTPISGVGRSNCGAVGEVRYVLGWIAAQVGRVGWNVAVEGKTLSDEEQEALIKQVANQDTSVQLATNLLVAGELVYAAFKRSDLKNGTDSVMAPVRQALAAAGPSLPRTEDAVWLPISTVYPSRAQVIEQAQLKVRGVWPHPANPAMADPPLFGVLDVLEEIEQLQDLAWAQNNSRVAQLGFLEIAKEYSFIGEDNGSNFHSRMQQAIAARMENPRGTGAEPITVTAPAELIGKGIAHTRLVVDPDERLEGKIRFAIQRLAYGFPVPPEILLGMTSTNRATAYQIEESTYKSHIETIATLVGRIYANAIAQLIDGDDPNVIVTPDPTNLLARRLSVPDLQWAYVNGLVSDRLILEAMGVDPDVPENLADEEDIARLILLRARTNVRNDGEGTPAEGRDQPAVAAAARLGTVDLDAFSAQLSSVDEVLFTKLEAAAERDVEAALRRLGAQCRTKLRQEGPDAFGKWSEVSNTDLPLALGVDGIRELGIDPRTTLVSSLLTLGEWWQHSALTEAHDLTRSLLLRVGAMPPTINGSFAHSADELVNGLVDWLATELEQRDKPLDEVPTTLLRKVVATAGRG